MLLSTKIAGSDVCDEDETLFLVPPHISPFDFGKVTLNEGESTTVVCTINKGDHPISIDWFLNGKPAGSIDGVSLIDLGHQGRVLMIPSVHAGHGGTYTCKATNWAGSAYYAAKLVVNGIYYSTRKKIFPTSTFFF